MEEEWIENAEDLVCEVYIARYEASDDPAAAHPQNPYVYIYIYMINCLLYHSPHLQIDEEDFTAFGNISMTKQVGSQSNEL